MSVGHSDGIFARSSLGATMASVYVMLYGATSLAASNAITSVGVIVPIAVSYVLGMLLSKFDVFESGKWLMVLMLVVSAVAVAVGISGIAS